MLEMTVGQNDSLNTQRIELEYNAADFIFFPRSMRVYEEEIKH